MSEVINLKVNDLDIDELVVPVKGAKGKKDRISVLPENLQDDLQNLIAGKKCKRFSFRLKSRQQVDDHIFAKKVSQKPAEGKN